MTHPADLAFGFDAVWIPSLRTNSTIRIDPVSNQIVTEIKGTGSRANHALMVMGHRMSGKIDSTYVRLRTLPHLCHPGIIA